MIETFLYCIILLFIAGYMIINKRGYLGVMLFTVYAVGALESVVILYTGVLSRVEPSYTRDITIFPYILAIISYLMCFLPFSKREDVFCINKIRIIKPGIYNSFFLIHILFSVIYLYITSEVAINNFQSGAWSAIYNLSQSERLYNSYFEYFIINYVSYFRLLALICGFVSFIDKNKEINRKLAFAVIVISVADGLCAGVIRASRMIIFQTLIIAFSLILFFVFNKNVSKKIKRTLLFLCGGFLAFFIIPTLIEISKARFMTRGVLDYALFYFGHAPIVFNGQVVNQINELSFGTFGMGRLFDLPFSSIAVGGTWGTDFYMYLGWIYIDWGTIGVLLFSGITYTFLHKIILKKNYFISDLFIIFSFLEFFIVGFFVIGRSFCFDLLGKVIIYFMLKIIEIIKTPRFMFKI